MPAHVSPAFALAALVLAFLSLVAFLCLTLFAPRLWRNRPGHLPSCPLDRDGLLILGAAMLAMVLLSNALALFATRIGWLEDLSTKVAFHMGCFLVVYPLLLVLIHHLIGRDLVGLPHASRGWRAAFGLSQTRALLLAGASLAALMAVIAPASLVGYGWQRALTALDIPITPQPVIEWFLKLEDPLLLSGLVLFAVIGAPVVEEILFRGILHPFLRARFGFAGALFLSSAVFAGFHLHMPSFAPLFVLAVALTLLYEWGGNLAACVAMHAGFNAIAVAGLLARRLSQ